MRSILLLTLTTIALTSCDIFTPPIDGPDEPPMPVPEGPPDLVIELSGPDEVHAGEDIGPQLGIEVSNLGGELVLGTRDPSGQPQEGGYMVDFVISTDQDVPAGFANFHPEFVEDGLLRGGRLSNTLNVPAGVTIELVDERTSIPDVISPGDYYICAQIDPANVVEESDESNNVSCFATQVVEASD